MKPSGARRYRVLKVAANASSWPPSARRIADRITGPSRRTGPVIRALATRLTRVPRPLLAQAYA